MRLGATIASGRQAVHRNLLRTTAPAEQLTPNGASDPAQQAADTPLLQRFEPLIRYTRGERFFPIDVEPKIHAIAAYTSQMHTTFRGLRDMAARVRAYYRTVAGGDGYAERVWYFNATAAP